MATVKNFEDITAWQKARQFCNKVSCIRESKIIY